MMIELPGTVIGDVTVVMSGGEDPVNEWSMVTLNGKVDKNNLGAYIIQEKQ